MASIDTKIQQDKFNPRPVKFILWLFILSSIMLFAGITSAYIVRQAEGNWKIFQSRDIGPVWLGQVDTRRSSFHWKGMHTNIFTFLCKLRRLRQRCNCRSSCHPSRISVLCKLIILPKSKRSKFEGTIDVRKARNSRSYRLRQRYWSIDPSIMRRPF